MRRHRRSALLRRRLRGVTGDIGDCGVGITPQMCNRVTNHGDMSTFSKPGWGGSACGEKRGDRNLGKDSACCGAGAAATWKT